MTYVFGNVANWFGSGGGGGGNKEVTDNTSTPAVDEGLIPEDVEASKMPEDVNKEKIVDENESAKVKEGNDEDIKTNNEDADEGGKMHSLEKDLEEVSHLAYNTAKDIGSYIFTLGKTYTEQVAKTAKQLKDTIEEKTIIGDFSKEQEKFVNVKKEKKKMADAAVPPWVGYNEEEVMKTQILELSKDKRNVLRNPPSGVQFHFDFENSYPVALVMLEEDERLKNLRFELVPKQIKEEAFWCNYFYRVSLIKQSAQLTSLNSDNIPSNKGTNKDDTSFPTSSLHQNDDIQTNADDKDAMKISESEFVSDAFVSGNVTDPELVSAMKQLATNNNVANSTSTTSAEVADWEREFQAELQEYEVVSDEMSDAALERELMTMTQLEDEVNVKANK